MSTKPAAPDCWALSLTASGDMLGYEWRVGEPGLPGMSGPDPRHQPVRQSGMRKGG